VKGRGVGIHNVDERIKLFFGAQYGASIASDPDRGTCVTIVVPIQE
jgi:two-component system sensor histidine kinase YesM